MIHTHAFRRAAMAGLVAVAALAPRTAAAQSHYIGEIKWVAFDVIPKDWAPCDGALLPISQNTALFSLLGTTYGGNGQTTYALPDMRGRFLNHDGQGPGLSAYDLGQVGGHETHQLTVGEMPAHAHTVDPHAHAIPSLPIDVKASSGAGTAATASGQVLAAGTLPNGNSSKLTAVYGAGPGDVSLGPSAAATVGATTGASGATTSAAGNDQAHPIMPAFLTLRCIIATKGNFPQRP
jgi:microcystin-dependent protein